MLFSCYVTVILLPTLFNYPFLLFSLIRLLAETNRTPFDLIEAESEIIAGFITEYSSIYFSPIPLTEYANIICFSVLIALLVSTSITSFIVIVVIVALCRSSLLRCKFDELMISI